MWNILGTWQLTFLAGLQTVTIDRFNPETGAFTGHIDTYSNAEISGVVYCSTIVLSIYNGPISLGVPGFTGYYMLLTGRIVDDGHRIGGTWTDNNMSGGWSATGAAVRNAEGQAACGEAWGF